jgi:hypothetical protein
MSWRKGSAILLPSSAKRISLTMMSALTADHVAAMVRARATADAVVGGVIGSLDRPEALVLGVFTAHGRLRVVGPTGPLPRAARSELGHLLTAPVRRHPWPTTLPASRFGQLPGARIAYTQVEPELVVEFEHDLAFEHCLSAAESEEDGGARKCATGLPEVSGEGRPGHLIPFIVLSYRCIRWR